MCRACFKGPAQYICVKHRTVFQQARYASGHYGSSHCPTCRNAGVLMDHNWRPPKKDNDKAWKMIAAGNYLWDI